MTRFYLCDPYTCDTLQQVSNILLDDGHHQLEYLGVEEAVNHLQDNSEFYEGDDTSRFRLKEDIILDVYPRRFSETPTSLELERFPIDRLVVLLCRLPLLLSLSASVFQETPVYYPTPNIDAMDFRESPLFTHIPKPGDNTRGFNFSVLRVRKADINLVTALSRISWTCLGIKSVKLWISHMSVYDYAKVFVDCLFNNIGKLYQLEELVLGADNGILTISAISSLDISHYFPGYLVYLKDLKQLSRVNFRNYGIYDKLDKITLTEILFMIDSWPVLQHLTLQSRCLHSSEKSTIADVTRRRGIKLSIFDDI
ncbi:hypothetical protein BGZ76_008433 [Entomortierella beljakovae]|nr:hypothetical protein BGZ76_008433 [Entomortierella beljakovae]